MPSQGTRIYSFRLPPELMEDVEVTMQTAAIWRKGPPWSVSDFVRIAIREKIQKMIRSRRSRPRRRRTAEETFGIVRNAPGELSDDCGQVGSLEGLV